MTPLASAFLRAAEEDLAAARRLLPDLARAEACHLQQAAEKLAKAELARGGTVPVPRTHDIGYLAGLLPPGHPLAASLAALAGLTEFSVAARYPVAGELAPPPDPDDLSRRAEMVEELLLGARRR